MVIDSAEIMKLDDLLKKEGIPHDCIQKSFAMGDHYEICIPSAEAWANKTANAISIAINSLTYGHAVGQIELWAHGDEPVGYLTAETAMKLIKERMR